MRTGARRLPGRQRLYPVLAVTFALLMTAVWLVPVVVSRGHGFDVSDEGAYLLSYRWWDVDARNFTGAQYIYGPVFESLGYSVPALRLARLLTVLAAHALFGGAFMSWLRTRYPSAVPSAPWVAVGAAALVAVGGVTYGWLPLSPGYDDVVALGCLVIMAAFFSSWSSVLRTGRLPLPPALLLPIPLLALLLAKWTTFVVVGFLAIVFVAVAAELRPSGWWRFLGAGAAASAVVLTLFHLLVAPLGDVVPPLVEVNRLAADSSHTVGSLASHYVSTAVDLFGRTTVLLLVIGILALTGYGLARIGRHPAARWLLAAAPASVVVSIALAGASPWPEGGAVGLLDYSAGLVALVLATAAALAIATSRPGRIAEHRAPGRRQGRRLEIPAVITMLMLLPIVQAVGSGNSPFSLAVNLSASWLAFMILGAVIVRDVGLARWFIVASGAATLVLCASVGADGVLAHPYRTTSYDSSDRALGGPGTLGSVAVGNADRSELLAVRKAMAPSTGSRPVIVLDELAGLALLTDGRPVGESWGSALYPERLAAGVNAACPRGGWRGDDPVVLAWRPVPAVVSDALRACGVRPSSETYREVRVRVGERTVRVFTPRG